MPSTTGRDGHNGGPLLEWSQAFSRMLQNGQIRHQNGNVGLQAGSPHNGNAALQMANGVLQNGDGVAMKRQASLIRENSFKRQNSWAVRDPKSLAGNTYTYAWGNNDNGQLGLRTLETQLTPQLVRALKGREIVSATGNLWNSAFLTGETKFSCLFHGIVLVRSWRSFHKIQCASVCLCCKVDKPAD